MGLAVSSEEAASMVPDIFYKLITELRDQLRLYGYCGHLLSYLETKKGHLEDMVKRTVLMSESNSVLIIGPRGSGKSALVECVLQSVCENKTTSENVLVVLLDGLVHTSDNLALEDITRQLGMRESEDKSVGSFSEKLRLLLSTLKSGTKKNKSVLFVLDNFDLFCSHKNQNLLYNLFDIAQSQQNPVCVIGLSARPDVLQALENRVNSRFSHQKILLLDDMTFDEYLEAAKDFLSLKKFKDAKFQKRWNGDVAELLKDSLVQSIFQRSFRPSKTLRDLKELLYLATLTVSASHPKLTAQDFEEAYAQMAQDEKLSVMLGLSVLELSLVVAMMHLTEIYDGEPFNFEIIFNELGRFLKNRMKWNIEKPIVMKAFEHLLDLELVKSTVDSTSAMKRYMLVRLLVTPEQVRDAVEAYQNLPVQLRHWTESNIEG